MKENSIEEDIKDIKKYISFTSKRENFSHDTDWNWNKDLANKIEHVLSDYKRVLKENEKLEEINNELEAEKNEAIRRYNFESIPVSLVEEKIEWLEVNILDNEYASDNDKDIAEYQVQALQELIKESEE